MENTIKDVIFKETEPLQHEQQGRGIFSYQPFEHFTL